MFLSLFFPALLARRLHDSYPSILPAVFGEVPGVPVRMSLYPVRQRGRPVGAGGGAEPEPRSRIPGFHSEMTGSASFNKSFPFSWSVFASAQCMNPRDLGDGK